MQAAIHLCQMNLANERPGDRRCQAKILAALQAKQRAWRGGGQHALPSWLWSRSPGKRNESDPVQIGRQRHLLGRDRRAIEGFGLRRGQKMTPRSSSTATSAVRKNCLPPSRCAVNSLPRLASCLR